MTKKEWVLKMMELRDEIRDLDKECKTRATELNKRLKKLEADRPE